MTKGRCFLLFVTLTLLAVSFAFPAIAEPLPDAVKYPAVEHVCQHDTLLQHTLGKSQSAIAEVRKKRHTLNSAANDTTGNISLQLYEVQSDAANWKPIRIGIFFGDLDDSSRYCTAAGKTSPTFKGSIANCVEADVLTAEKKDILINYLVPEAMKLHEARLLVQPISGEIIVPDMSYSTVCGEFTVPSSHHTSGVSGVDFVVYVAAGPIVEGSIAWALTCAYLPDGKPVVGAINIAPRYITRESSTVRVIGHEILHALGFNSVMFTNQKMMSEVSNLRGKPTAPVLSSPRVLQRAKEQYGCDTAPGMELEDQGSSGNQLSHWKRRNAVDEIMSPISGIGYYTALTIAAMEDTGYYKGNYSNAETMMWGKNAGCKLLDEKCVIDGVSQVPSMFYGQSVSKVCPSTRMGVGYVPISQYSAALPSYYQYFSDPTMGGTARLVDYCPIAQSYSNTGCTNGDIAVLPGSVVSANSRCFDSPTLKLKRYAGFFAAICLQVKCNEAAKNYQVKVQGADKFVDCPIGGEIQPASYSAVYASGTIKCPQYDEVCQWNSFVE